MDYIFEKSTEGFPPCLDLFSGITTQTGILSKEVMEFGPQIPIQKNSPIQFVIPGTGSAYTDLRESKLYLQCSITRADKQPMTMEDKVSVINAPLHTIFKQVIVTFNQIILSSGISNNYAVKSILDLLVPLKGCKVHPSALEGILFFQDNDGALDSVSIPGPNIGLQKRAEFFSRGKVCELEGTLCHDIFQSVTKNIPFGVDIGVKLYRQSDSFILLHNSETQYEFNILNAVLKVSKVHVNPNILAAHALTIKKQPMIFPYKNSDIKTYSLSRDITRWTKDDITSGRIPERVLVCLVHQGGYSPGHTRINPFDFQNFDVHNISFIVDGKSVPGEPHLLDYNHPEYNLFEEEEEKEIEFKENAGGGNPNEEEEGDAEAEVEVEAEAEDEEENEDRGGVARRSISNRHRNRRKRAIQDIRIKERTFLNSYLNLYDTYDTTGNNDETFIKRRMFPNGYAIYRFDIAGSGLNQYQNLIRKGHTRLNISFKSPTQNAITIIVYSTLTGVLQIDEARNIIVRE